MAADADEATSALIAKLLAEDSYEDGIINPSIYYDEFEDEDSYDEEESRKRRRRKKKKSKEGTIKKKPKASNVKKPTISTSHDGERKRATPRAWTEQEEKLFLESLELYGRDWRKCSEHIKTRDPKAVSSHCQKYFIKLYKENKPLPDKVKESGEGYTLSGKPLDPNSAAARAYGLRGAEVSREYRNKMAITRDAKKKGISPPEEAETTPDAVDNSYIVFLEQKPEGELTAREKNDLLLAKAKRDGVNLRQKSGPSRKAQSVRLIDMVEKGILKSGPKSIQIVYQDKTFEADLLEDGTLEYEGKKYDSPSGFSIAAKRTVNPDKMADCGWKSCSQNGVSLERLKRQYLELYPPQNTSSSETEPTVENHETKINDTISTKRMRAMELRKKKAEQWAKRQAEHRHLYDENGQTEYSRGRTRRTATTRFVAAPTTELTFVRCSHYHGKPGSGQLLCQPFQVFVHSSVYALVDVHSHLSKAEVMGFLAGRWDSEKKVITVLEAFPGKSLVDGATECEMDPVTEVDLRASIEKKGYKVVGWYHSHPTFQALPSSCDIDNQANYQALFRDNKSMSEPFIGLIDSPYDDHNPSETSRFSWFYVDTPKLSKEAKHVETQLIRDTDLTDDVKATMMKLISNKDVSSSKAIDFHAKWREIPGSGVLTYSEKFERSISIWLPRELNKLESKEDTKEISKPSEAILKPLMSALKVK